MTEKMRILFVANAQSVHMHRWLLALRDKGHDVHIASFDAADIPGITVHRLPTYDLGKAGYFTAIPALRRLAKRLRPHVAHAHYLTSYGFVSAAAGLHPLVLTAMGSDIFAPPGQSLLRHLVKFAVNRADHITVRAEHMVEPVRALCKRSAPISVIPNGIRVEQYRSQVRPVIVGTPSIISTRAFTPIYDHPTLLRALGKLRDRNIPFQATMAGDGPLRASLQAQADALGLTTIFFTGALSSQDVAAHLGRSDIYVSSSLSDGNSVSLMEAMASGCLPIVSDIAANRAIIEHGRNGMLFIPGDSDGLAQHLESAIHDWRGYGAALTANAAYVQDHMNFVHCLEGTLDIYSRLVHENRLRHV